MQIGNKTVIHSGTYLIPKGDSVTDTLVGVGGLKLELAVIYDPKDEDKNRLKWELEKDFTTWRLNVFGPISPFASSTTDFSDFGEIAGKRVGFVASFFGTEHLCTVHLQILKEL